MRHLTKGHYAARINQTKGFRIHLLVFLLATPLNWLIWHLTGQEYPWPLWQTFAWAIGVWFHYLGVFVFRKNDN